MVNKQDSFNFTDFVIKNSYKLLIFEKISNALFALGLILYLVKVPNTNLVLVIGIILTALSYFLSAFKIVETEDMEVTGILNSLGFINFIYKLYYFSLSVSAMAMLGLIVEFKKGNSLLAIGCITLPIIFILSIFTKLKDRTVIYNFEFYFKMILWLILLSYLANLEYHIFG